MALNSSGPISLGGPTVGQSINLELGNAATATASINSTPFRTLAGIASGTIALSSFYGKSNSVSYITYFLATNLSGEAAQQGPVVLSNTGYAGIALNQISSRGPIGVINPDGTKSATGPYGYDGGNSNAYGIFQPFASDWTTLPTIPVNAQQDRFNLIDLASPGAFTLAASPQRTNGYYGYANQNISRDASGNLYRVTIDQPNPKYEAQFTLDKYNSSGTPQWYVGQGSNSPAFNRYYLIVQSAGVPVWVYNNRLLRVFTSNGTSPYQAVIASGLPEGTCFGAAVDANNVIWIASENNPNLRQVNAAKTSIQGYHFSISGDGAASDIKGIAHYNGYIYVLTQGNATPANTAHFYLTAFSSTNGTEYWTKKLSFAGTNTNNVGQGNFVIAANNLQANSQGVAFHFVLTNPGNQAGGTDPRYFVRFPLNGAVTTTTYSNIAANASYPNYIVSLTIATVARTFTSTGTYATSSSGISVYGANGNTGANVGITNYTGAGYFSRFKQNIIS